MGANLAASGNLRAATAATIRSTAAKPMKTYKNVALVNARSPKQSPADAKQARLRLRIAAMRNTPVASDKADAGASGISESKSKGGIPTSTNGITSKFISSTANAPSSREEVRRYVAQNAERHSNATQSRF